MPDGRSYFLLGLTLCCILIAQGVLAQADETVQVEARKAAKNEVALNALLDIFEVTEGLKFGYALQEIEGIYVDSTFVKTWDALAEVLPSLGLIVRTEDSIILLAPQATEEEEPDRLSFVVMGENEPLTGAVVQGSNGKTWVTDAAGKLVLAKAELPNSITIKYLGFVTEEVAELRRLSQVITLRRDTMLTAAAEVVAPLPTRLLPPVSAKRSAESAVLFNAQALPPATLNNFGFMGVAGVNTLDGQSALPAIRGSQGSETLVELDGLPLYHIDHLFGLFSAINPQAVEQVDLYRSHYPADRGGFRGGLMEIRSIPNNANSVQLDIDQLSAAGTVTGVAGPIRVLASARSSLGNVAGTTTFQEAGAVNDALDGITTVITPDFSYYDAYGRIDIMPSGSRWSGTVNGYTSRDKYSYGSDSREILDERRRPLTLEGNYLEASSWRNLGFGGSIYYKKGDLNYSLSAHRTDYEQSLDADSEFSISNRLGTRSFEAIDNELDNTITDQQLEVSVGGGGEGRRWSAGIQAQFLQTQARFRFRARTPLNLDRSGRRLHTFATLEQPLGKDFSANIGLRATRAFDLDNAWISPRAIVTYKVPSSDSITSFHIHAGYSYTRQATRALQHENQFGQNYTILVLDSKNGPAQAEAHNFTFGFSHNLEFIKVNVEAYYRHLPGILASLSSTIGLNNDRVIATPQPTFTIFSGEGMVTGMDADVHYAYGPFEGQAAYTISESLQSFQAIAQGAWQLAPDNRRRRFATTHSYTQGHWSGGFNYEGASGLVYNDLNAVAEASERELLDPADFQEELPNYHRVDVFGKFEQPFGKATEAFSSTSKHQKSFSVGLRLYNAFNRANVTQRQYILNLDTGAQRRTLTALGTDVALLGRVLLVEVGVRF